MIVLYEFIVYTHRIVASQELYSTAEINSGFSRFN